MNSSSTDFYGFDGEINSHAIDISNEGSHCVTAAAECANCVSDVVECATLVSGTGESANCMSSTVVCEGPASPVVRQFSKRLGRTYRTRRLKQFATRAVACDDDATIVQLCKWMHHIANCPVNTILCEGFRSCQSSSNQKCVLEAACNGFETLQSPCIEDCSCKIIQHCEFLKKKKMENNKFVQNIRIFPLKAAVFPITGRGLMTLRNIAAGEDIVCIPRTFMISCCDVIKFPVLGKALKMTNLRFTATEILASFVLFHKKIKKSFWTAYINSFPESFDAISGSDEAAYYPDCMKKPLLAQWELIVSARNKIATVFQQLPCIKVDETEITWAFLGVNSRSVYLELREACPILNPGDTGNCALAPFLDLLNHSYAAHVNVRLDHSDQCYKITTLIPFEKYDQVFINYGAHDNVKLFVEYGFFLSNNPNDSLQVSMCDLTAVICSMLFEKVSKSNNELQNYITYIASKLPDSRVMFLTQEGPSWSLEVVTASVITSVLSEAGGHPQQRRRQTIHRRGSDNSAVRDVMARLLDTLQQRWVHTLQLMDARQHKSRHFVTGCAVVQEIIDMIVKCKANYC